MNQKLFYDNVFHVRDVPSCLLIIYQSAVDVMIEINHIQLSNLCCQLQIAAIEACCYEWPYLGLRVGGGVIVRVRSNCSVSVQNAYVP